MGLDGLILELAYMLTTQNIPSDIQRFLTENIRDESSLITAKIA